LREGRARKENAHRVDGHCFYYGSCYPGDHDWEGMQTAEDEDDRIGLLLDLDQGTMTVYKNDERLGVMATGLSGEYSWAVSLRAQTSACASRLLRCQPLRQLLCLTDYKYRVLE
jgi:hypothetical protein